MTGRVRFFNAVRKLVGYSQGWTDPSTRAVEREATVSWDRDEHTLTTTEGVYQLSSAFINTLRDEFPSLPEADGGPPGGSPYEGFYSPEIRDTAGFVSPFKPWYEIATYFPLDSYDESKDPARYFFVPDRDFYFEFFDVTLDDLRVTARPDHDFTVRFLLRETDREQETLGSIGGRNIEANGVLSVQVFYRETLGADIPTRIAAAVRRYVELRNLSDDAGTIGYLRAGGPINIYEGDPKVYPPGLVFSVPFTYYDRR